MLNLLQHQSLPQKLKKLSSAIEPEISKKVARRVSTLAREFRTFEAHGGAWDEMKSSYISPTLSILAGMCALWDLTTSGFPVSHKERRLGASRTIRLRTNDLSVIDGIMRSPSDASEAEPPA